MIIGGFFAFLWGGKLPKLFKKGQFYILQWFQWVFCALFAGKAPKLIKIFNFQNLDVSRRFSRRFFSTFFSTFCLDVLSRRFVSTSLEVFSTFSRHFWQIALFSFFVFYALFLFFCLILFFILFCFLRPVSTCPVHFCVFYVLSRENRLLVCFWRCDVQFVFFHADSLSFSHCTRATQEKRLTHSISAIAPENVRQNDSNSARNSLQIKLKQSSQANSDKLVYAATLCCVKSINKGKPKNVESKAPPTNYTADRKIKTEKNSNKNRQTGISAQTT